MPTRRKPTALKLLDGDRPDRINPAEPASPPGLGDAPAHLTQESAEAWEVLAAILPAEVACRSDRLAAELLARSYAGYRECWRIIGVEGFVITDESERGAVTKGNPAVGTMLALQKSLIDLLKQFGLTPAARAGLMVAPDDGSDPLLDFLKSRRPANPPRPGGAKPKDGEPA